MKRVSGVFILVYQAPGVDRRRNEEIPAPRFLLRPRRFVIISLGLCSIEFVKRRRARRAPERERVFYCCHTGAILVFIGRDLASARMSTSIFSRGG